MKKIKKFILLLLATFSYSLFAGESGYMLNGKKHIVFKDGKKVGNWLSDTKESQKRNISSNSKVKPSRSTLYFEEDDLARCYYFDASGHFDTNLHNKSKPIHCIRK